MSRVGQIAGGKPAVLRVGQTAEKESWRCRGDRQTARVRKAGGKASGSGCRRLTAASGK